MNEREKILEILDILNHDDRGRIVLCNILASIEEGIISRRAIKDFFKHCVHRYRIIGTHSPNSESIIKIFESVALNFLFHCKQSPCDKEMIHITTYENFTENFVDDGSLSHGHTFIPAVWSFVDEPFLREIIDEREISYSNNACFGGNPHRPFFWIAPAEDISSDSFPGQIRNLLGLIHYNNVILIKFIIKANDIKGKIQARPTFIEGGSHRRFRIRHNGLSKNWGYAVNLELLARGTTDIDGAREKVVEPTPLNAMRGLVRRYLGGCGESPECTDSDFGSRICEDMWNNPDELKNRLKEYLNDYQ